MAYTRVFGVFLILVCVAGATPDRSQDTEPKGPSVDWFYKAPANIGTYKPGDIIRHRPPPLPIVTFDNVEIKIKKSYQILYRTANTFNQPIATVLTVLVPPNADFKKVLSYQAGTDAAYPGCAPSLAFQRSPPPKDPPPYQFLSQIETSIIIRALEKGWVVILPDYEGPKAAFIANKLAAHAILDGIRAAKKSRHITGICKKPRVVLWGYSGGSLVSGWAAELQQSYAPDVKIAGAALGGTVPNLTASIISVNDTISSDLIASGIAGLGNEYPAVRKEILKHATPTSKPLYEKVLKQCAVDNIRTLSFKTIGDFFGDPNIISRDPIASILKENSPGHHTPKTPLLIYKAIHDQVSAINETDQLVKKYCKNRATVDYRRDANSSHTDLLFTGFPAAFEWLGKVLDGRRIAKRCSTTEVDYTYDQPEVKKTFPASVIAALSNSTD